MKSTRTVNDNFYVINRRASAVKPLVTSDSVPSSRTDSDRKPLKTSESALRPKNSLSNTGILEEENSAIAVLLRKTQAYPEDASVQFELGRAYHSFRLYSEALVRYENALRLDPKNAVYLEQTSRLRRDWGSLELGADLAKQALEIDPGFVDAWNTLGTIFERQGNSAEAQRAYLEALSLNPGLDYVNSNLCFSYLQVGNVEQAIRHGEHAVRLNPTMLAAHNNLGIAYGMRGDLDRSLAEFIQGGDEAGARNNLGLILLKQGQFTEAMQQFKLAVRLRPFYKVAAANYWKAREMKFQKDREAKVRLKSFDYETAMEARAEGFGLQTIQNTGWSLLDGTRDWLSSPPSAMSVGNQTVTVDVEGLVSREICQREFGEIWHEGNFRLGRVSVAKKHRYRTTVLYKEGYVKEALELARRIPGNQAVFRSPSNQKAEIRILLGRDFVETNKRQRDGESCARMALAVR